VAQPEKPTEGIVLELKQGRNQEDNARLLFKQYYGRVYRFFHSKRLSPEDCEELTEDVFISVYQRLGELREAAKFESWLFRMAMNAYLNEIERRGAKKRAAITVSLEEHGDPAAALPASPVGNPEVEVLEKETLNAVRQALQELPPQMRHCVLLRVDEELSYQEIAVVMGISLNTVSAHLHQARSLLKEKLGRYFGAVEV
jgi:RNA polymerase sigma-70 factor (ECF subfamily)